MTFVINVPLTIERQPADIIKMAYQKCSAMRAVRRAMVSIFCFWLLFSLICSAQEESLGDVGRRVRAERAAKAAALAPPAKPAGNSSEASRPVDLAREAFVIERSATKITVETDGTAIREVGAAVRINSESGVKQFAVLKFAFTSLNEQVEIDSVKVRKPDGTVISTPESNVQEMTQEVARNAPMYTDVREKHVTVRGLGTGDLLEYTVRIRTVKPQVPGQFWFEYSFLKDAMIKDERLEISYPSEGYLNVRSREVQPDIRQEGGRRIYRWSSSNLKKQDADAASPRKGRAPLPSVQVSTFRSWDEVGRWYGGLQQEQVKVTPLVQAKAAQLTKGLPNDDDRIRAIYNYVSLHIHYVGMSFGIGRYQPHASDDVLSNEYGDCKDKYTLLASLLKAAGYDSWPVLINSSREIDPELPSPGQFDHVIAAIPRGGNLLWADSTPEIAPAGLLFPVLRDKVALAIPPSGVSKLVRTPAEPPFASSQLFAVTGKLDEDGTLSAHMEETDRGDSEAALRAVFRQVPPSQWNMLIETISHQMGFGGTVDDVQTSEITDLAHPFHISYEYTRKKMGYWESRQIMLPLPGFGIERKYDAIENAPREPEELGAPTEVVYRLKLELPPGYTVRLPKAVHLVKPYIEYHATHVLKDNVLTTTRRMIVKQHSVPSSDWDGFRSFCKEVTADESTFLQLRSDTTDVGEIN